MDNFQSAAAEGGGDCGHYRSDGAGPDGRGGRYIPPPRPLPLSHLNTQRTTTFTLPKCTWSTNNCSAACPTHSKDITLAL